MKLGRADIKCVLSAALFLTCVSISHAKPPTTQPGTVDQQTIDAAMARLKAKQAAGESLTEKVQRLEAENAKLKRENQTLTAQVSDLKQGYSALGKGVMDLAGAAAGPNERQKTEALVRIFVLGTSARCNVSTITVGSIVNGHVIPNNVQLEQAEWNKLDDNVKRSVVQFYSLVFQYNGGPADVVVRNGANNRVLAAKQGESTLLFHD